MLITPKGQHDPASEVLKQSGILRPLSDANDKNELKRILNDNSLSLEEVIAQLSFTAHESRDETLKLRAIDTALKLHGAMNDEQVKIPSITIVIQPKDSSLSPDPIPSILIPREVTA